MGDCSLQVHAVTSEPNNHWGDVTIKVETCTWGLESQVLTVSIGDWVANIPSNRVFLFVSMLDANWKLVV
eukprot:m.292523 g.292523  ORF g.292523 m.292523 type:complete len:70 (+) comp17826_c0_seq12:4765-4974(+)